MGTTAVNPTEATPATEKIVKKYGFFSADTFEMVNEERTVDFVPPVSLSDAMARIGNDQDVVLKALTGFLRRQALNAVKQEVMSKGLNKKVVLGILRPFRALPPYSLIEDRKKQTEELLKLLRDSPVVLAAVKAASAATPATEDDEDEDDEG